MTPKNPRMPWPAVADMPPAATIWVAFGDTHSKSILMMATNNDKFKTAATQFHAQLFLIVRGLLVDEMRDMFTVALPPYLSAAINAKRLKAGEEFEKNQAVVENQIVKRIRVYAKKWLRSPAGSDYQT